MVVVMLRRDVARLLGGASLLPIVGCEEPDDTEPEVCDPFPRETAGPYPGNGTNGANALALSGIVRSDIRSSVSPASGVAEGVVLTLRLVVIDAAGGCAPLSGYAVYLWHCDRAGDYSMYTGAAATENYLRGVQETDDDGEVAFVTTFPGCYAGRWPHAHFEIYENLDAASNGANALHVSQLALPDDACIDVYAQPGYEQSATNLDLTTLESDGVFADGAKLQLARITGNVTDGYVATLVVGLP
jgi:protocatechuate 3,4-dioxygenase beta subunit